MSLDTAVSSLWQTLVTGFSEANEVFVGTTNLAKSVYRDYSPIAATIGQTLNVPIPTSVVGSVSDGSQAYPTWGTPTINYVPIAFNQFPRVSQRITTFEQFNSPVQVKNVLVDPILKGIRESINNYLWTLVNTTNFNSYGAALTGTGSDFSPANFTLALEKLAENKVPVTDTARMSFLAHPRLYYGMMTDNNWSQYLTVGALIAEKIHEEGVFPTVFGVNVKLDQAATASGTAGARTFTGLMLHEYAMALATRPLPDPDPRVVQAANFLIDGVPIQLILGYNLNVDGWCVIGQAGFGAAVVRPECGVVVSVSE